MKSLVRLIVATAAAVVLLAGCSAAGTDSGEPGNTGAPTAAGSASTASNSGTTINITLGPDGKVDPSGKKVDAKVGDTITFVITSDHDDEVHIHGIDVEIEVKAGETVTHEVTLDTSGSFEVESHHPAKVILILNVR